MNRISDSSAMRTLCMTAAFYRFDYLLLVFAMVQDGGFDTSRVDIQLGRGQFWRRLKGSKYNSCQQKAPTHWQCIFGWTVDIKLSAQLK